MCSSEGRSKSRHRPGPPAAPSLGACYIVADGATDAWAGREQDVAAWTSGGWRFIPPFDGMRFYERSSGTFVVFRNGGWESGILRGKAMLVDDLQVVGPRAAAIGSPTGGAVVDAEARATLDALLVTLRQHGLIEV